MDQFCLCLFTTTRAGSWDTYIGTYIFLMTLASRKLIFSQSMGGGQDWWSNRLKVVKCVTISANNFGVHAWMITLTTLHKLPLDSKKICLAKGWKGSKTILKINFSIFVVYSLPDPSRPSEPSAGPSTPELSFLGFDQGPFGILYAMISTSRSYFFLFLQEVAMLPETTKTNLYKYKLIQVESLWFWANMSTENYEKHFCL